MRLFRTPVLAALTLAVAMVASGAQSTAQVAATPTPEARIVDLEAQLKRQSAIADNARKELERLRKEIELKDELIVLGYERNAEMYAIAAEVVEKGIHPRSLEPFLQRRRVDLENLKQAYEDRLRAARIFESTLAPSARKRMNEDIRKDGGG